MTESDNSYQAIRATLYPQKHRSGNVTYKVKIGKRISDGKDVFKNFDAGAPKDTPQAKAAEAEATEFMRDWNLKLVNGKTSELQDLDTVARHEILAAVAKLKVVGATLPEAVDFFLKYARPSKGQITIKDAIEVFLKSKEKVQRSEFYLRGWKKTFLPPFLKFFPEGKLLSEVSEAEAAEYIDSHKGWNAESRNTHINYLTTFYNFHIKNKYAKLNPFKCLDKPQAQSVKPKVISPAAAHSLLQFALNEGSKAECACMVAVFFCGVRVQEIGRLSWEKIDLEGKHLTVEWNQAKKRRRRVNTIPENALEWFKLLKAEGRIRPNDYDQRMKRLRGRWRDMTGLDYPQNAMRHSFASYHIAKFNDAPKTAYMLAHDDPNMLYNTYYQMVKPQDAESYWQILPAQIEVERKAKEDELYLKGIDFLRQ